MTPEELNAAIGLAEEAAAHARESADRAEEASQPARHTRGEDKQEMPITVAINSPHTASVIGRSIALQIKSDDATSAGGGGGDSTVAENIGVGTHHWLIPNSNVRAKTFEGHVDGSVLITEDLNKVVFQSTPATGNSYPVAVNECPSVGGIDTELTPAVVRVKFIGRLLSVTEPSADVVHVVGDFQVQDKDASPFTDINTIKFTGAGVLATDLGEGVSQVEVLKYPIAVSRVTPVGGTDDVLTTGVSKLIFEGRLFSVSEPIADQVTVKGDLRVYEDGSGENTDIFKIKFVGATVSALDGVATVTVPEPGEGVAIPVFEEASQVTAGMVSLKFVGDTITATAPANAAVVTMSELVFRWNVNGASTDVKVAAIYPIP